MAKDCVYPRPRRPDLPATQGVDGYQVKVFKDPGLSQQAMRTSQRAFLPAGEPTRLGTSAAPEKATGNLGHLTQIKSGTRIDLTITESAGPAMAATRAEVTTAPTKIDH